MTVRVIGVAATIVYTTVATYIIIKLVGLGNRGLRVTADEESQGLDILDHEER